MYLLGGMIFLVLVLWGFERFYLRGGDAGSYTEPADPEILRSFPRPGGPGPEFELVVKAVRELTQRISTGRRHHDIAAARKAFDDISEGRGFNSEFRPVDAGGVPAEWVTAGNADHDRRVLYIHGGAFVVGSPLSHRAITSKFAEISGCAVLAIDYRLMPE